MSDWLAILIILLAGLMVGGLIFIQFVARARRFDGDGLAALLISLTLGLGVLGLGALALAEAGGFSIGLLSTIGLGVSAGLSIVTLRRGTWRSALQSIRWLSPDRSPRLPRWLQSAVLAVWLVAALGLFFRPHEFLVGGADAGVYVSVGANIARTGSLLINDPTLRDLDRSLYPLVLRALQPPEVVPYYLMPGFYVAGEPVGQIIPQFYPLYPVWQAVASGLSGVRAELLTTGVWALLGALAVYLTVRQWGSWRVAALTLAGLTLCALQIWFARYPTAEMLTQFLIWIGLWALGAWLTDQQPAPLWGLVAGLAWGEVFLTRIDTYFLLIVPLVIWLWRSAARQQRRSDAWFYVPLLSLATWSVLHALVWSYPYFLNTFGLGTNLLQHSGIWVAVVAALSGGVVLLIFWWRRGARIGQWLLRRQRALRFAAIGGVIVLVAYVWVLRPVVEVPPLPQEYWYGGGLLNTYDHENWLRLGWYLSPIGLALAAAGACLLIARARRGTIVLIGVGLFFSLLYVWRIQANPHQIYAMRRYVPVVFPFLIIAGAYTLGVLLQHPARWARGAGALLAAAWLIGLAWSARGFVSQIDYAGLITQLDQLNARLAPHSVLLFNDQSPVGQGDFLGTPLHFIYGQDVYSLRDPAQLDRSALVDTIRHWQTQGRTVYWVNVSTGPGAIDLGLAQQPAFETTLVERVLEHAYDHKPTQVTADEIGLQGFVVEP